MPEPVPEPKRRPLADYAAKVHSFGPEFETLTTNARPEHFNSDASGLRTTISTSCGDMGTAMDPILFIAPVSKIVPGDGPTPP